MKKFLLVVSCGLLLSNAVVYAQRKCGAEILKNEMIARNPAFAQQLEEQRASLQAAAAAYKAEQLTGTAQKTTSVSAIPVVFHIVVDSIQVVQMGGEAGVIKRVDSQLAVIERDFNGANSDSSLIPNVFRPYYASTGIHFGLAHTSPTGASTPGYEIVYTPAGVTSFSDMTNSYSTAKHVGTHGADAWDPATYLNVWVINFDATSVGGLLGITTPHSFVGSSSWQFPTSEEGICISYKAFGVTAPGVTLFYSGINKGRTLTHELGHFFEIWHTWGDDGGSCPGSGGQDDGIADTPPETDAHYGDPTFPLYDACSDTTSAGGVMFMDYMDYVNDKSMYMFTADQSAVMAANVIPTNGESHTLTQHPDVLNYPTTAVANVENGNSFNIYPNPTNGAIKVSFDQEPQNLQQITIVNMLGQSVNNINTAGQSQNYYSIDLSGLSKGIYFVRCNFASGSITRKILLQ